VDVERGGVGDRHDRHNPRLNRIGAYKIGGLGDAADHVKANNGDARVGLQLAYRVSNIATHQASGEHEHPYARQSPYGPYRLRKPSFANDSHRVDADSLAADVVTVGFAYCPEDNLRDLRPAPDYDHAFAENVSRRFVHVDGNDVWDGGEIDLDLLRIGDAGRLDMEFDLPDAGEVDGIDIGAHESEAGGNVAEEAGAVSGDDGDAGFTGGVDSAGLVVLVGSSHDG